MASTANTSLLINPPARKHIVLLYDDAGGRDAVIADYINAGLDRGQFCVYATVHFRDKGHIQKFSSLITNYEENVEKGNLLVVDLAGFYVSALIGDMKPFDDARKLFEERARERADRHVRFVGDGTGFLFKNHHFDECAMIEQWWQEKPFEGSYLCPFQKETFDTFPHNSHAKNSVMTLHDTVIDISGTPLADLHGHQQADASENKDGSGKVKVSKGRMD